MQDTAILYFSAIEPLAFNVKEGLFYLFRTILLTITS